MTGWSEIFDVKPLVFKLKTFMNLLLQLSNTEGQIAFRNVDGLLLRWQYIML